MVIDMNEARLDTIEQIREFLAGTGDVVFSTTENQAARHRFVATVLNRHRYFKRSKGHRGVIFAYSLRLTGYTRQHLTKLIGRYRQAHHCVDTIDAKGKLKKTYPQDQIMTPYERLTSMADYESTLRPGETAEVLQQRSVIMSDSEAAKLVQESRSRFFQLFNRRPKVVA
jgi:hypothetical protein